MNKEAKDLLLRADVAFGCAGMVKDWQTARQYERIALDLQSESFDLAGYKKTAEINSLSDCELLTELGVLQ